MLSTLGYAGLRAARIPAVARLLGRGGVILCYHNVLRECDSQAAGDPGLHLTVERFAAQARWLARHYTVVPLGELVTRIRGGRSLRGLAAITFDDGYSGAIGHAVRVLRELRLPATVFVVASAATTRAPFWWDHPAVNRADAASRREHWLTGLRGDRDTILSSLAAPPRSEVLPDTRPAGWGALLAATVDGIDIGAHSLHHRSLTTLSPAELEADLTQCREIIAGHIGRAPAHFAYPYGHWDRRVREAVRRAGFAAAVTLGRGSSTPRTDLWELPRVNIPAGLGDAAFESWVAGVRP